MSEYDDLLAEAKAKAEAFRATVRHSIPRIYRVLLNENPNLSPADARIRIKKDCLSIWSRRTIIDALPEEAKDPKKQKAGRLGQKKQYSAAVSAAQNQQVQKQIIAVTDGSTIVKETTSLRGYEHEDSPDRDLLVRKDDLSCTELLNENEQLRKKVIFHLEERARDADQINDLKAALAKESFKPAIQLTGTPLTKIILDLQKFGSDLITMIRRGQSTCVLRIDQIGNVVDIEKNNSSVETCSGGNPA